MNLAVGRGPLDDGPLVFLRIGRGWFCFDNWPRERTSALIADPPCEAWGVSALSTVLEVDGVLM